MDPNENSCRDKPRRSTVWTGVLLLALVAAFALSVLVWAEAPPEPVANEQEAAVIPYPLETCLVSGEPLDALGAPVRYLHGNQEVLFCCDGCRPKFEADPQPYLERIDAALIEQQRASYPLETCLVSGMALGSMGEPIDHLHEGRLVRFCCDGCREPFAKDPASHLKNLEAAYAAQAEEAREARELLDG